MECNVALPTDFPKTQYPVSELGSVLSSLSFVRSVRQAGAIWCQSRINVLPRASVKLHNGRRIHLRFFAKWGAEFKASSRD